MTINNLTGTVPAVTGPLLNIIESVIDFNIYVLGFNIDEDKIKNIESKILENNYWYEKTNNKIVKDLLSNEKKRLLDSTKIKVKYSNLFLNAAVLKMVVWFVFDLYKSDFDPRELNDYQ